MTGQERGILERYLERQDDMLLRLDDRLTVVEARQMTDQAANNQRFEHLETAVRRIEEFTDALGTIERAADVVNTIAANWKRALLIGTGLIAFVAFVIDAVRWIILGWPF